MRPFKQVLALVLVVLTGLSSQAFAQQQHVVDPAALAAAAGQHVASESADREAIRAALVRQDVRDTAASMGLDLDRMSAAVDTMGGPDLEHAASVAQQIDHPSLDVARGGPELVEGPVVGGSSTVVISTTTIIIVLLLIILIVVIAH